ncbi:hypothetical protein V6N13_143455 [Hibiscus sabdariffa]|uniref:Uncharacterized protein n=1 Tax=Hibiscus sabdariffa TaxID=183260 RepID=A0ABR2FHD4_9ROSI
MKWSYFLRNAVLCYLAVGCGLMGRVTRRSGLSSVERTFEQKVGKPLGKCRNKLGADEDVGACGGFRRNFDRWIYDDCDHMGSSDFNREEGTTIDFESTGVHIFL